MNYTDMQERLDVIRNLPICELDKRQPLLVALIADIVNAETSDGDDTNSDWSLESQNYWHTLRLKAKDAGFNLLAMVTSAQHLSMSYCRVGSLRLASRKKTQGPPMWLSAGCTKAG